MAEEQVAAAEAALQRSRFEAGSAESDWSRAIERRDTARELVQAGEARLERLRQSVIENRHVLQERQSRLSVLSKELDEQKRHVSLLDAQRQAAQNEREAVSARLRELVSDDELLRRRIELEEAELARLQQL